MIAAYVHRRASRVPPTVARGGSLEIRPPVPRRSTSISCAIHKLESGSPTRFVQLGVFLKVAFALWHAGFGDVCLRFACDIGCFGSKKCALWDNALRSLLPRRVSYPAANAAASVCGAGPGR